MRASTGGRLLVVGWPTADWDVVERLLQAGRLPHLAKLAGSGCTGRLAVPPPACEASAWTTMATGFLADRHGVLADGEVRPDGGGVGRAGLRSWHKPAFWEVLEGAGLRTICVGWPATAPGARWPGCHVDERFASATGSDFDNWAMLPDTVAPDALRDTLRELRIHPADGMRSQVAALLPEVAEMNPQDDPRPMLLEAALAQVGTLHAVATYLAEGEWDLLCVCHDLLRLIATGRPADQNFEEEPFTRLVERAHVFQDMMLGRLVQLAPEETAVIVASAGWLVAAGPGIGSAVLAGAALTDLAPSILARFGLRCETDGRPLAALASGRAELTKICLPEPQARATPTSVLGGDPPDTLDLEQVAALRRLAADQAMNLAEVQIARGWLQQAAATLERLRQSQPGHMPAVQRLAECHALLNDAGACLPLAETLLEAEPGNPWGHLLMGACCVLGQDHVGARPHLDRAAALGGTQPNVALRLGGLHLLSGRPAEAAACFRQTRGAAEGLYGLGIALSAQGETAAAADALRQSLAKQHCQPDAHRQLAIALMAEGQWRDAMAALADAEAQQPDHAEAAALLAEARSGWARDIAGKALLPRR